LELCIANSIYEIFYLSYNNAVVVSVKEYVHCVSSAKWRKIHDKEFRSFCTSPVIVMVTKWRIFK